jgi:hypothetical protein
LWLTYIRAKNIARKIQWHESKHIILDGRNEINIDMNEHTMAKNSLVWTCKAKIKVGLITDI